MARFLAFLITFSEQSAMLKNMLYTTSKRLELFEHTTYVITVTALYSRDAALGIFSILQRNAVLVGKYIVPVVYSILVFSAGESFIRDKNCVS